MSQDSKVDLRETFTRIPKNVLVPWLDLEKADAYRYLVEATDPVSIHRAQGKLAFIDKMRKLLEQYQNT